MSIRFNRKRNRLHVGYRAADWSDVWMEQVAPRNEDDPQNEADDAYNDDGEIDFDLYQFSTGDKERREPMPDEVKWHQHFDPKNCDSTTATGRTKLQKRLLHDAFQYLTANNAAQLKKMEKQLTKPREARWSSWFDLAKKYKRRQIPELRQAGDDDDDDESDDDDSAYDSADEYRTLMGPPRRAASSNKRKAADKRRQDQASKRTKTGFDRGQRRLSFDRVRGHPLMSGGLGTPPATGGNVNGGAVDDRGSETFDPSPPEGVETVNNVIHGSDFDSIRSPNGHRRRGMSRSQSPLSSNGRGQNGSLRNGLEDIVTAVNGDMSEDEAFQRAREESERLQ